MLPQTSGANTDTWLRASKDITINAHIEGYTPTSVVRGSRAPTANLYDVLTRSSVPLPVPSKVILERGLEMELGGWGVLSDEALNHFEEGLC